MPWSAQIPAGFLVSHSTWEKNPRSLLPFRLQGCRLLWPPLSRDVRLRCRFVTSRPGCILVRFFPATPVVQRIQAFTYNRFRLFPFRSPLLGKSHSLSFPEVTKMVQFASFALIRLWIQRTVARHYPGRVAPFGDPRI